MLQRIVNTSDNSSSFTLEELHPYYEYTISIAAVSVGVGPFTVPERIQMPQAGKCVDLWAEMCELHRVLFFSSFWST